VFSSLDKVKIEPL